MIYCKSIIITLCFTFCLIQSLLADEFQNKIRLEADYIVSCQWTGDDPAYGAINNIFAVSEPTWIVPRENAMAILGLLMASDILADPTYAQKADHVMNYLISVQSIEDGSWYDQYSYENPYIFSKSLTQTAEVMMAMAALGFRHNRYVSMKRAAEYLLECQKQENKQGIDDGLICGGKNEYGVYHEWRWVSDNSYAYIALRAAEKWALLTGDILFARKCSIAAKRIINGIDTYLYNEPVWHQAIDSTGTPVNQFFYDWINYAPQMLDIPAHGVGNASIGEWIHSTFQLVGGGCIGPDTDKQYPGLGFQAALCWLDLGQKAYSADAVSWAENSGLWQTETDANGIAGGWIDWVSVSEPAVTAPWWERFIDTSFYAIAVWSGGYNFNPYDKGSMDEQLYQTAYPYIEYFKERALDSTPASDGYVFEGLTRSFQINLGEPSFGYPDPYNDVVKFIEAGASSYDQSILGRICLADGLSTTTIIDTYLNHVDTVNSPLIKNSGGFTDDQGQDILNGPYRIARILQRDAPGWWDSWDWILDTGAAATLVLYACEAYAKTQNPTYEMLASVFADYILQLQDADGGVRYGPIGMHHPQGDDFFWKLKVTEQNQRALYALQALYMINGNNNYNNTAEGIKLWLKNMYNFNYHLFHTSAAYENNTWVKSELGTSTEYVATDTAAFAPIAVMLSDTYFGISQDERDNEVDAMFNAIESRTAFLDSDNMPILFKFSTSQYSPNGNNDFGSVEFSSQMALAYLRTAQIYNARKNTPKTLEYLKKYNVLVNSLADFFSAPDGNPEGGLDPDALVCPYASYLDASTAGGVYAGTGYYTYNCKAALASSYYAFAKTGYDPTKIGGGCGIPETNVTLNLYDVPWYQSTGSYDSTGAATARMILNYIRYGAKEPLLDQDTIYEYAKGSGPYTGELKPDEIDRALGHFDPYDYLISNWSDRYDSLLDGNPYKGYNFTVNVHDSSEHDSFNNYIRDICHWIAYTVTKEEWWRSKELVARPHCPAAVPIHGNYNNWVAVTGYAVSADLCPEPRTNPFNSPDFTVYGLWIKDPSADGIGRHTYKTAAECATYFLPLNTGDAYDGKYLQVAEPPPVMSKARVKISDPLSKIENLKHIGVKYAGEGQLSTEGSVKALSRSVQSYVEPQALPANKRSWEDMVDIYLLSDPGFRQTFDGSAMGKPVLVTRTDNQNLNYYLVPFGSQKHKQFLTSGVIIIDAYDGHFKEAGWTEKLDVLFKVDDKKAVWILRRYLFKELRYALRRISRIGRKGYHARRRKLLYEYLSIVRNMRYAQPVLQWQPGMSHSPSPYKPYWVFNTGRNTWYVTQGGSVVYAGKDYLFVR